MAESEIITGIENIILQWHETGVGKGNFGAITFLYRAKEFGHLHKNGDLDIVFGKQITMELRQKKIVQKHLYVPETSVTYNISSEERLPFAISLLRFSYLRHFIKVNKNDTFAQNLFENEMAKLPESLSLIYRKSE